MSLVYEFYSVMLGYGDQVEMLFFARDAYLCRMAKLTLDNFEANTPSAILKRGRNYFDNGHVSTLDALDDGSWAATVDGSDRYDVRMQLKGKQISGYECDCPYDGDPCKHVVAVWYAIRGNAAQGGAEPKKNKKISLDTLLNEISTEEFRAFVKDLASRDADFRTDFELYFADKGGVDVEKRYADVIRKIIRKHTNRGYIEYRSARSFSSDVDKITSAGTDYVNKGNYRDAFMLVKATLLPLLDTMSYADDSAGHIGGCINDTIQLLADLASNPDTPRPLLMDMLDYLLTELTNSEYFNYGDFGWELFGCLEDIALKLDEADRLLSFIDMKLAALTGEYDSYDRTQCVRTKMFVLDQIGRK